MTNLTGFAARQTIQLSPETRQKLLCEFTSRPFTPSSASEHTAGGLLLSPCTRTRLFDEWLDTLR